jgi:hypothetical protein
MAIRARKTLEAVVYALVEAFNGSRKHAIPVEAAALTSTTVTTADADATYGQPEADLINEIKADFNLLRADVVELRTRFNALAKPHFDATEKPIMAADYRAPTHSDLQITAANGDGTVNTLTTLANQLKVVYVLHIADAVAHKQADATNTIATADATDLPTAQTLLNEIKTDYNLHRASTTFHQNADATNNVTAADATDQASADTLANDIKAKLNAHVTASPSNGRAVRLVAP